MDRMPENLRKQFCAWTAGLATDDAVALANWMDDDPDAIHDLIENTLKTGNYAERISRYARY